MSNDCVYYPGDIQGVPCWKKKMNGKRLERRGDWKCSERYPWVDDNEQLATKLMPMSTIRWLLIAESPPCPRNLNKPPYIYRVVNESEERPLLEAIVSAYEIATNVGPISSRKTDKLSYMSETNGAFVMDLCSYPINKLGDNRRATSRTQSEKALANRIVGLSSNHNRKIENIAIIGIDWRPNVVQAIQVAGMGHLLRNKVTKIPFPSTRPRSRIPTNLERCAKLLAKFFADPEYEKKLPIRSNNSSGEKT